MRTNSYKPSFKQNFYLYTFVAMFLIVLLSLYVLNIVNNRETMIAVLLGSILGIVNTASSYYLIKIGFGKSFTDFSKIVFGGMGIRLLVVLSVLVLLVFLFDVEKNTLLLSFLSSYVIFLIPEVIFVKRRLLEQTNY